MNAPADISVDQDLIVILDDDAWEALPASAPASDDESPCTAVWLPSALQRNVASRAMGHVNPRLRSWRGGKRARGPPGG